MARLVGLFLALYGLFLCSSAQAATYYVNQSTVNDTLCSPSTADYYCNLQAALDAAVTDGAASRVVIEEAGVYHGPFVVPYVSGAERSYELSVVGSCSGCERDDVVLDNPSAGIGQGIPVPAVIATGFEVMDTGVVSGMPLRLEHLTVAASEVLVNGGMEGSYVGGLAPGWSKSVGVSAAEVLYDRSTGMYVLAGDKAQVFSGSDASSYIYTVVAGSDLGGKRRYTFSVWFRRRGGSGDVRAELRGAVGASPVVLSTSVVDYADMYNELTYTFVTSGNPADLEVRLYCGDTGTEAVVDGVSLDSPVTVGVFFKGAAGLADLQGVDDCVVRNIGHVAKKSGGSYQVASWSDLDDPLMGLGDDVHGHAIVAFSGAAPLITDCDIRQNYDGVNIADESSDPDDLSVNPRLWSSGLGAYGQLRQRIRGNARFGVTVRNGATPYIGKADAVVEPVPQAIKKYANHIRGNGFANISCQDDAAPRIYYNLISGGFDWIFRNEEHHPGGYGVISRERAAPIIVGNWIFEHNRAGVAARDETALQIGDGSVSASSPGADGRVNFIRDNNLYAELEASDPNYVPCTHGAFDNIDCAAVASMDGAQANIYNNYIYGNWAGVGSRDWAAPDIRGNWIKSNEIGISFMSVRDLATVAAQIGGAAAGDGNEVYQNKIGIAIRNSGNRVNRVLIEGNNIYENLESDQGIGIAVNNSFVQILNNDINDNASAGLAPGKKAAIALFNSSDALITSNRILNNGGVAIASLDSVVEVEHNLIADNFPHSSPDPLVSLGYGVVLGGIGADDYRTYLFNGGFEGTQANGVAPEWKKAGSLDSYVTTNSDFVHQGSYAQVFSGGGASSSYLYYPAMVSAGKEYHFSGWLKRVAGTGTVYVQLAEPAYNTVYTTIRVTSDDWRKVRATFTAVVNDLLIKLYTDSATQGVVDEFELLKVRPGSVVKKFNHNIVVGDKWNVNRYEVTSVYIEGNTLVKELRYNILGRGSLGVKVSPGEVEHSGTLSADQTGLGPNQLRLENSGISTEDGAYMGMMVVLAEGSAGLPKEALIVGYDGVNRVAIVEYPVWTNAPEGGDSYQLISNRGRIDPGAVDYNLVYAWDSNHDTDGTQDGYMLNGASPGENTYYYGEYYGNPSTAFFQDPNHNPTDTDPGTQDYYIDDNSLVYTHTYKNGTDNTICSEERLGLGCNFNYPPDNYSYRYPAPGNPFPSPPTADQAAPQLVSMNPGDGSSSASPYTAITLYIKDEGSGDINSGLVLDGIVKSSLKLVVDSVVYSDGDPDLFISPDQANASQYKLIFDSSSPLGANVDVGIYAEDEQGNIYSTTTPYSFSTASGDTQTPQLDNLSPKPEDTCIPSHLQPTTTPIQFELSDSGVGVDIETASLTVATWDKATGSLLETLYNEAIYPYSILDNHPVYSSYTILYRPECDYDNDIIVSITITAYDYEANQLYTTRKFCIVPDTTPPEEVAYLKASVSAQGVVSLLWDPSIDSPLYDGLRPDPCDSGDLDRYELLVCSGELEESLLCTPSGWSWQANLDKAFTNTKLYELPIGKYKFRLRGVDTEGNQSMGALANRNAFYPYGEPLVLYEGYFDEDFNGASDDFADAHLDNWQSYGGAGFSATGGILAVSGSDGELLIHNFAAGDFEYSTQVTLDTDEAAYLLIRKISGSDVGETGYAAYIDLAESQIGFYHVGDNTIVATETITPTPGTYTIEVTAIGKELDLDVSGAATGNLSYDYATSYTFGRLGIWQPHPATGLTVSTIEYDNTVIKDYTDRWVAAGSGSWDTTGTPGGDYQLTPGALSQDITVEHLILADDFILQTDITIEQEGSQACLLFQKENESGVVQSGYAACVDSTITTDHIYLYRIEDGINTILASTTDQTIDTNTTYHLKLLVSGPQFTLYGSSDTNKPYDYDKWLVTSDTFTPIYHNGAVGFWQQTGTDVTYDNLALGTTEPFNIAGTGGTQYNAVYTSNTQAQYDNIQNAINSAQEGGYIYLTGCNPNPVIYDIGKNTIQMKKGVSLLGAGPECTIIKGRGKVLINAADEASIEGIKISGSNKKSICIYCANASPLIINTEIVSCYDAIRIGGPDGTSPTVTASNIHDNAHLGIGNNAFSSAWIYDNRIWANGLNGIGVQDNATPRIEDNIIGSSGDKGKPWSRGNGYVGVGNRGNSEATIVRNDIKQNYGLGIGNRDNAAPMIEQNQVHDNSYYGIGNFNSSSPTIIGNRVYNNASIGIASQNESDAEVRITNNKIYANQGVGIGLGDGNPPFSGTAEVTDNTIFANLGTGSNAGGIGGQDLSGATVTISNNRIYSHTTESSIGFYNTATNVSFSIKNNTLDNSTVASNGNYGIEILGGSGDTARITGNTIKYFGLSGIRLKDFTASDALSIQSNTISTCGTQDYVYAYGENLGDGSTCIYSDGCPAASGIQILDSTLSGNSITGNTIRYNPYSGIALRNTDGYIGPGNLIYENGNLTTEPGPLGGGELCPTCVAMGTGVSTGDGGLAIRDLAAGKELRIYETTGKENQEIYSNHVNDIRVKPGTQGKVYLNNDRILPGSGGGQLPGFGVVYDCFEPGKPECNQTISGLTFANNDRYGILVRGPFSENLIIEGNIIQSNMLTQNSNNVICSGTGDKDYIGGGIALTCGARPVIRNNIIRNNGASVRPRGKGSHSGINMWQAGDAQIYSNEIYGNANDGIGIVGTPHPDYGDQYNYSSPQIGVAGQSANKIYNNGRYGIGITTNQQISSFSTSVVVQYNEIYSNPEAGIGVYESDALSSLTIYGNSISYNGVYTSTINQAGGIGFYKFAGTAYIDSNTIASNNGSGTAAGGIGIREFAGGTINIGTNTANTLRYNVGGAAAGDRRCGAIGGRYGSGTVTISNNDIHNNNEGGIGFDDMSFTGTGLTIDSNNQIHHNDKGIRLQDVSNVSISNNQIYSIGDGTEADPGVTRPDAGIAITDSTIVTVTSVSIIGNTIQDNNAHGISISDLSSGDTVTISSNTIGGSSEELGNELGGIIIGVYDNAINSGTITIDDSSGANTIRYNQRSGISIISTDGVTIQNNIIVSNGLMGYIDNGLHDASGIRVKDSQLGTITGNTIRWNTFSGIAAYSAPGTISGNTIQYNGSGGQNCTDIFGPGGADGGVSVRYLALGDTLIVTNNTITDNILSSVSCNPDTDGEVRLNGSPVDCGGFWNETQARVYVDSSGVYVDGNLVSTSNTQIYSGAKIIVDCTIPSIPNPITGGEVWGIAIVGGVSDVVVRNCVIENNQVNTNNLGPGGTSMGGGILVGPGCEAQVYDNSIRYNGSGPSPGSNSAGVDGNTSTEWKTHPGDFEEPHWFGFTLDSNTQITSVRVYTGAVNRTWNVYFGPKNMWKPTFNAPTWDAYKIITDASVGGTPGWVTLNSENPTANQRRLWIEITGGQVDDHLYELEYNKVGSGWLTPEMGTQMSCGALKAGNAGVIMRCTSNAELRNNTIYSNANNAIEARGTTATIGPDNEIYSQGKKETFGIWTVAIMDDVDLTIYSNDFHGHHRGIGMNYASGNVTISSNDFHDFITATSSGIGCQALGGDLTLNIRNNDFWNNNKIKGFEMEQNRGHHLDLNYEGNVQTGGFPGLRIRYIDNADIMIRNNTITDTKRFGIQLLDNGAAGVVTNITIYSNTISDNQRTGIRFRGHENATVRIEKNDILGNAWNPGNDNTTDNLHFKWCDESTIIISGNTISNSAAHPTVEWDGIGFKENTGTDVTISYNTISNHPEAGIEFKDNIIGTAAGATSYVNIRHNDINNNDLIGIRFEYNTLDMTTLFSNEITYNGLGSASSDWGGIWFQSNDNVWVEKNHCAYNTGIGFRFQDSSNIFIGWKDWDPLNIDDPNNPSPGDPYCYPYPAGDPLYAKGTVPWCKYASNMRAVNQMDPCGNSYFDPDPDHSWANEDLWDNATGRRQPGTGTNMFYMNTSWAIQIAAFDTNVSSVEFRGNVVAGNGGPGFGFTADNAVDMNATIYACNVTDNPGGDGIQAKEVNGQTVVDVVNTRVVGGDAVEGRDGAVVNVLHGSHLNIKLRLWNATSTVYNYNYIGCINRCVGGMGGEKGAGATYYLEHYNCIGGHVPMEGGNWIMGTDHNWFDMKDTFETHEGGAGYRFYNGNRFAGGYLRKNHNTEWTFGDGNVTEPNYFPNGVTMCVRSGNVNGNYINGGTLQGGDGGISGTCNVGSGSIITGCGGSNGNVSCYGNQGSWSPSSCTTGSCSNYWGDEPGEGNGWTDFCAERNCIAPDASPYW